MNDRATCIRFRTEMGSVYEVVRDDAGMRWRRLSTTLASGVLRSEEGQLIEWPQVRVGERCEMLGEPLEPPFPRFVSTSVVVAILAQESGQPAANGARR